MLRAVLVTRQGSRGYTAITGPADGHSDIIPLTQLYTLAAWQCSSATWLTIPLTHTCGAGAGESSAATSMAMGALAAALLLPTACLEGASLAAAAAAAPAPLHMIAAHMTDVLRAGSVHGHGAMNFRSWLKKRRRCVSIYIKVLAFAAGAQLPLPSFGLHQ